MKYTEHPYRSRPTRRTFAVALCLSSALTSARAATAPDPTAAAGVVSLKIPNTRSPPGGLIQVAVSLTEPAPIMTSYTTITYGTGTLGPVMGVALFSPAGALSDVAGTALLGDGQLTVRTTSPSADFGTLAGPILTVAISVPPTAPMGAHGRLAIDPATSLWIDPSGQPYAQHVKNGAFEIAGTLAVSDVSPGLGLLPAGSTVTVRGIGFRPGALVEIDGVPVASTTFVSDTELHATTAADANLYGRGVYVRNPDRSKAAYYAYPRTAWLPPSAQPLLAATDPIFSPQTFSSAVFANAAAAGQFLGLALQNPNAGPADVTIELWSEAGVIASTTLALPPLTRISREVTELFAGTAAPADAVLAVRSDVPVQMLGVVGDDAAGSVVPLTAAVAIP